MNKYLPLILTGSIAFSGAMHAQLVMKNATLESSKSWLTGNAIEGHLEEVTGGFISAVPGLVSAVSYAVTGPVSGSIHANITLKGTHTYSVSNPDSVSQPITVGLALCTSDGSCFKNQSNYTLRAKATVTQAVNSYLTCVFPRRGDYTYSAYTSISGAAIHNSNSSSTISIR